MEENKTKYAKLTDEELAHVANTVKPGSDEHYDAIMEHCNRGLTTSQFLVSDEEDSREARLARFPTHEQWADPKRVLMFLTPEEREAFKWADGYDGYPGLLASAVIRALNPRTDANPFRGYTSHVEGLCRELRAELTTLRATLSTVEAERSELRERVPRWVHPTEENSTTADQMVVLEQDGAVFQTRAFYSWGFKTWCDANTGDDLVGRVVFVLDVPPIPTPSPSLECPDGCPTCSKAGSCLFGPGFPLGPPEPSACTSCPSPTCKKEQTNGGQTA